MDNRKEVLTYKQDLSKAEIQRVAIAIGAPLGVLAIGIFTITNLANFGTKLICPLSAAMWIIGLVVAALMPAMRKEVLNQTLVTCALYYLGLLALKILLGLASGVSSEMIAASFDQAIPTATGNAIPGYLQNIMWFTAVGVPIGFVSLQGKRLFQFKKSQTLNKTFGQKRSIRENGQNNTQMFNKQ